MPQRIVASCRNGSQYRGPYINYYISLGIIPNRDHRAGAVRARPATHVACVQRCAVVYIKLIRIKRSIICLFKRQRAQSTPRNLRHLRGPTGGQGVGASARYHAPMSSDPAGYRALYFFLGGGAASTGAVGCTSGLIMYSTSPSKTPRSPSVFTSGSGVPNALV